MDDTTEYSHRCEQSQGRYKKSKVWVKSRGREEFKVKFMMNYDTMQRGKSRQDLRESEIGSSVYSWFKNKIK